MSRQLFVSALVSILISACSPPDLTRDQAESLLGESEEFLSLKQKIYLHSDGIKKAQVQGAWTTPKGMEYVSSVDPLEITLTEPINIPTIMITGMANLNSLDFKEVKFTWEYQGVPAFVRRFSVLGGTGEAIFRRYDDGWRIEEIKNLSASDTPAIMSTAEIAEEQDEIRKIQEAIRVAERNRQEAIRVAEEERARYIAISKVPTETMGSYTHYMYTSREISPSGQMGGLQVTITDVNLYFQTPTNEYTIWFGWIRSLGIDGATYLKRNHSIVGKDGSPFYTLRHVVNIESGEYDRFFRQLKAAHTAWRSKYPDL